jgi:uncharacterized membrane protein YedE/YeeE
VKKPLVVAFFSGLIFALGLGVSAMTQPAKIIGFLDLFGGAWDPSLMFVMAGAIGVHLPLYRWARARGIEAPAIGTCGPLETAGAPATVDRRLLLGAGIFGVGWGLGGYCPGPAVVSIASAAPGVLVFVAAMVVGMWFIPAEAPEVTVRSPVRPPRVA